MKARNLLLLLEYIKQQKFNPSPKIGWWLDNDPITFYHGTHIRNKEYVEKEGLMSSEGWVSLALEPNTAFGYASMSGVGGEKNFRKSTTKVEYVKPKDRIVFVVRLPKSLILKKMAPERGAMQSTKTKLVNKSEYEGWKKSDQEYYALTEIRIPKVEPKYIVGFEIKK